MESSRKNEISKGKIQELIEGYAKELLRFLESSSNTIVLTGAGVSTDSGIPDFRSSDGLYSIYDPNRVFDIEYFLTTPSYFYDFARKEILKMISAKPSATHYMLAELEKRGFLKAVITQNIDLLHQKAGSKNVIELHGNVKEAYCLECKTKYDFLKLLRSDDLIPRCEKCGGLIKPNIVFFGESLPENALNKAFLFAKMCDLIIVMGSSLVVHPAASLPLYAVENGAKLLIINKGETPLDHISMRKYECNLKMFSEVVINFLNRKDEND